MRHHLHICYSVLCSMLLGFVYSKMTITRLSFLGLTMLVMHTRLSLGGEWLNATATWYGSPEGDGSTGGACGYGNLVGQEPYRSRVSAGNPLLWKRGKGCGECYKVKCTEDICSGKEVPVIITDECPGCDSSGVWFDLSGTAFGRMAVPGQAEALRNKGKLSVLYTRTKCTYPGMNLTFRVNEGSSEYFFSILIQNAGGDGDAGRVQLQQAGSNAWMDMTQSWGANWALTGVGPLKPPFSLSVTSFTNKIKVTAMNVIPSGWYPTATYTSSTQLSQLYVSQLH